MKTRENRATRRVRGLLLAATIPTLICTLGISAAHAKGKCNQEILKGKYAFTATGFNRAPDSAPGTPWGPKAILEVLEFNGDGTLNTPILTVANPFGDTGDILHPPAGASGDYSVNEDCSGTVHFLDASNTTYTIYVELPGGNRVRMIQTRPTDNVIQGTAKRIQ
jgi:hypothetical protein